jgi:hypothetical protein
MRPPVKDLQRRARGARGEQPNPSTNHQGKPHHVGRRSREVSSETSRGRTLGLMILRARKYVELRLLVDGEYGEIDETRN